MHLTNHRMRRRLVRVLLAMMTMRRQVGIEAWIRYSALKFGRKPQVRRSFSSSSSPLSLSASNLTRVAIVGGGLAGLSTAYHLLDKAPYIDITIFDKKPPGLGGASSVAGGYVSSFCICSMRLLAVKDVSIICYSSWSLAHDDKTYNQDL